MSDRGLDGQPGDLSFLLRDSRHGIGVTDLRLAGLMLNVGHSGIGVCNSCVRGGHSNHTATTTRGHLTPKPSSP